MTRIKTAMTSTDAEPTRRWTLGTRSGRAAAAVIAWAAQGPDQLEPVRAWWLNPVTWLLIGAVAVYRHAVPDARKPDCCYTPSCSRYTTLALKKYGAIGGVRASTRRLRRCASFGNPRPITDWP
jgi:putative component of membrane protein insertase Oxa1/YidC/SpoIIIJ protein YidD